MESVVCALAAMAATQSPAKVVRKVRIGDGDCFICPSSSNKRRCFNDTEFPFGVSIISALLTSAQDEFKNGSRARKEADFGAKNTPATALAMILELTLDITRSPSSLLDHPAVAQV